MQTTTQSTRSETPCHRMPVLRRNDRQARAEELVKVLQQLLNKADLHPSTGGFPLTVDGFFGAKTEAAVKDYQAQCCLVVDGIVGSKTWNALGACIIITES
ncbi:MAG TPA: peptidoglycan-binding domain-containing protein [Coleofasciculaceae cyanobacterium]